MWDGRSVPAPLVVDENLHYRLLKVVYGQTYQEFDPRPLLQEFPPLYGVWHPYKYVCTVVYRVFHPFVVYLLHGTADPGQQFPTAPRLRTVEMLYAAILQLPGETLEALDRMVRDAYRAFVGELGRVRARGVAVPEALEDPMPVLSARRVGAAGSGAAPPVAAGGHPAVDERALHRLRLYRRRFLMASAMQSLVVEYVPAAFVLGYLVRCCNWDGARFGSGTKAKEVLMGCLLVLLRLLEGAEEKSEYVRTLSCTRSPSCVTSSPLFTGMSGPHRMSLPLFFMNCPTCAVAHVGEKGGECLGCVSGMVSRRVCFLLPRLNWHGAPPSPW